MDEREKPKMRPQSLMAQNFSMALDSVFGLDTPSDLAQTVEKKKEEVNSQSVELQALEARLKAMEERLKTKQRSATLSSGSGNNASRAMGNDRQPTNNVSVARQVQKQPVGTNASSARPVANTAASIRNTQRPAQRKVEESSEEEEEDEDEEDDSGEEEDEDEEDDEEEEDSGTEDSSSVEERK